MELIFSYLNDLIKNNLKTRSALLTIVLLLQSCYINAQQGIIMGLAKKAAAVKEVYFSTVDPITGNVTLLSNPYISQHIVTMGATLDNVNNLYYYQAEGNPYPLKAVDIFTGSVVYSTPMNFPSGFIYDLIQYNCLDSSFYGVEHNLTTQELKPLRMDVTTGLFTYLSSNSIIASARDYTFDKKNNILYFMSGSNTIVSISLSNGNVLNSIALPLVATQFFENLEFNCMDSLLYGTYRDTSGMSFAKVNLTSGVMTVLSSVPFSGPSYTMGSGHILDENSGIYYFNSGIKIYTFDILNNNLLNSATLSFSQPGTFNLYYIKKSLDCDCSTPVAVHPSNISDSFHFYPNPVTTELFIQTNNNESSEIIVYDITSREILKKSFTSSTTININLLSGGVYTYEWKASNGDIRKGKFVKN